jgi:hypothetical protein
MKNFLIIILILAAVGYYFDISPTDFLPTVQNTSRARDKSAAGPAPAAPAQPTTTATTNSSDGSLTSRWSPEPSPKKP